MKSKSNKKANNLCRKMYQHTTFGGEKLIVPAPLIKADIPVYVISGDRKLRSELIEALAIAIDPDGFDLAEKEKDFDPRVPRFDYRMEARSKAKDVLKLLSKGL